MRAQLIIETTHAEEMPSSLAIPLWFPTSPTWKKLDALRQKHDRMASVDITDEWKSFTPAQRQELLSYGWRVSDTRTPGQVTIHAGQDALTQKLRSAVTAKQRTAS